MFVFTLTTKSALEEKCVLFSNDGDVIGRILHKSPKFKDEDDAYEYQGAYTYDVECDERKYQDLVDKKATVLGADDYIISSCNTHYVRKDF